MSNQNGILRTDVRLIDYRTAGAYIGLSHWTIREMVKSGTITKTELKEVDEVINLMERIDAKMAANKTQDGLQGGFIPPEEQDELPNSSEKLGIVQGAEFRQMFPQESLSRAGWKNFGEFVSSVHAGQADVRLRALVAGVPSDDGFLVPTEYSSELFNVSLESEVVRPRAQIFPMSSGTRKIPATAIGSHSCHLFGGLVAT